MKSVFRRKYNIPEKSIVFIYGGNLGKLQGLNFLLTILERNKNLPDRYFFIVGSGTEYHKINSWLKKKKLSNVILLENLPKDKYEELITIADVGLIFLDPRFTIPNYPSRLLSYMENKMPVLFAVDKNTDIGTIAVREGYGFSCLNGETETFNKYINLFISKPEIINRMGMCGYNFLNENYSVKKSYEIIMKHFS
jgi:glycosyltransferase involved in cell wall biosynthesis